MTLNELKYICALAKEKRFKKAAEVFFISQPTLSVAIKKIEDELEVTLFERKKNEVLVTPIGEKIIFLANEILNTSQQIKLLARNENKSQTELKLGAIYTVGPYLLPKLIPIFHEISPKTHLIVEENYTHVLAQKLQQGEIDVMFISLPFQEPNIEILELYTEDFVAALPNQHPLAKHDRVSLEKINNETFLLLGSGHCFRDQVTEAYPNLIHMNYHSDNWQKTLEGSSLETIRYMVASGAGITVLPCTSVQNQQNDLLTLKPLTDPVPNRTVIMAWRKTFPRKELIETLKQSIQKINFHCTVLEP